MNFIKNLFLQLLSVEPFLLSPIYKISVFFGIFIDLEIVDIF